MGKEACGSFCFDVSMLVSRLFCSNNGLGKKDYISRVHIPYKNQTTFKNQFFRIKRCDFIALERAVKIKKKLDLTTLIKYAGGIMETPLMFPFVGGCIGMDCLSH